MRSLAPPRQSGEDFIVVRFVETACLEVEGAKPRPKASPLHRDFFRGEAGAFPSRFLELTRDN